MRVCVRRVRAAHHKVHSALGDYSSGPPATPLTAWPENTNTPGTSGAALQLAQAQREAIRMEWDLSVLKRTLPELEAAVTMSERMSEVRAALQATLN